MRVGISTGERRPDEAAARAGAGRPPRWPAPTCRRGLHRREPYVVPAVGEKRFTVAARRPRHQGDDPAADGRARHRGARAAGHRDARRRATPSSPTASSSPTAPATRPPPTHPVELLQGVLERGTAALRDLLRQPDARPRARLRHLQAEVRPPRHQPAGAWTARPARSRSPRTTTASPSTRPLDAATETPYGAPRSATSASTTTSSRGSSCVDDGALRLQVQYHPEAAAGPHDAAYLFDRFVDLMAIDGGPGLMPKRTDIQSRPGHRLRPDRHRPGRASSTTPAPRPAACCSAEGLRVDPGQLQPGDDHDRPGVRRRDLRRADHPGVRREDHRQGAPRRAAADPRRPDRAERRDRAARGGVLEKYGVELIGANIEAIDTGENRELVQGDRRGRSAARSARSRRSATRMDDVPRRPSTTLRLPGRRPARPSRWAAPAPASPTTRTTCAASPARASRASPTTEVLLEESILGWKEYELEVMRDNARQRRDRLLHREPRPDGRAHRRLDHRRPGDDADRPRVPAPARHRHRASSARSASTPAAATSSSRSNPDDGRRDRHRDEPAGVALQRAGLEGDRLPDRQDRGQGWPIGYTLDEIPNDITAETPASFEPTLDYVVVKVPRFAFEKFPAADPTLTTHMKSVGEAMAIGRNFTEALQKALRSLEKQEGGRSTGRTATVELDKDDAAGAGRGSRTTAGCSTVMDAHPGRAPRRRRSSTPPGSTRGSSTSSSLINEVADEVVDGRRARPRRCCGGPSGTASPTRRSAEIRGMHEDVVRGVRHALGRPAGLQDGRHLRRRVRRADAVPLLVLRRGDRGRSRARSRR